ncbi:MAG: mechanosensitive ion channel family protein [Myxococcota bacterium]
MPRLRPRRETIPTQDDLATLWTDWPWLNEALGLGLLLAAATLVHLVVRRVVLLTLRRLAAASSTHWDDAFVEARVFSRIASVAPALVVYFGIQLVPDLHDTVEVLIQRVAISVLVAMLAVAGSASLSAVNIIYSANPENRKRPIKGYLQVVQIALFLVAGLLILATLLDRSPWIFLSGLGALAAVLLLVFRDTILGLVASIQLTGNDMVHVGDWIEMPRYGADGDVIDVALHTVKVQNWDKTITTIPTHKLIEESFKNWRGMSRSGGRRIKRAVYLDTGSIRFLSDEEVERAGRIRVLADYIEHKTAEIAAHNADASIAPDAVPDQRRLTNLGTLRAYIHGYLRRHPRIHQGMTLLVRQLAPTEHGLPIEIYAFTNTTAWGEYEDIQSDLFDHIFAILPEFGLRAFQSPSGADLERLGDSQQGVQR